MRRTRSASAMSKTLPNTARTYAASASLRQPAISVSSTSSKRVRSELAERHHEEPRPKKCKLIETAIQQEDRLVFFPVRMYYHACLGILFTSSSIRGRGTTVFCVLDLEDEETELALKKSWKVFERVVEQDAGMRRLAGHEPHPNVIAPCKTSNAERNGNLCTTLCGIRGFLDGHIDRLHVENRILRVSVSELKRPVKYFWGLHDFVRGLRGALLGHEFLMKVGIRHRDMSENNIALGIYPWEERGYLIDFDMAILQDPEEPARVSSTESSDQSHQPVEQNSTEAARPDEKKRVKRLRTGALPYLSFGVLLGERHTHFDDVESFLYVLLLFFFSYAGPLSKEELEDAHKMGFVQSTESGRLSHVRNWPKKYADWADENPHVTGLYKHLWIFAVRSESFLTNDELQDCLANNWPEALHLPIRSLLQSTLMAFSDSMKGMGTCPEVSHAQFISTLDNWLVTYSALENEYSNCPNFKDSRTIEQNCRADT